MTAKKRKADRMNRRDFLKAGAAAAGAAAITGLPYLLVRPAWSEERGPISIGNIVCLISPGNATGAATTAHPADYRLSVC